MINHSGFRGLEKLPVTLGFALGDRPFFLNHPNPESQIVSPVTFLISQYVYNITNLYLYYLYFALLNVGDSLDV